MRIVTPAIVLRSVDYGEADRIVTLLTRSHGKVAGLARGARRSVRRFGAGLSLFGVGEAVLNERPQSDLLILHSFDSARGFAGLASDVAKVAHASYGCELCRELSAPRQADPRLFDLLLSLLAHIDEQAARAETLRLFELQLLEVVGLAPEIDRCLGCGVAAPDDVGQVFDSLRGGLVCGSCHGHGLPLTAELRQTMSSIRRMPIEQSAELTLSVEINVGLREAVAAVLLQHLGRPLKSLEFIAKLNHAQSRSAG